MKWIISNNRRPTTDGFYFTEDSEGARLCTEFNSNHWHSETNNPIAKWIDENESDAGLDDALTALENLVDAVPNQDDDHDWWSDSLRKAMEDARFVIRKNTN
jgi:hypothetical protein